MCVDTAKRSQWYKKGDKTPRYHNMVLLKQFVNSSAAVPFHWISHACECQLEAFTPHMGPICNFNCNTYLP